MIYGYRLETSRARLGRELSNNRRDASATIVALGLEGKMGIEAGLNEFGIPTFLIAAVVVTAIATLVLHFLFPPAKGNCRVRSGMPPATPDDGAEPNDQS